MTETSRKAQWFSDNERNWDDRAELHMAGNYCDYQHLLEDPTAISAELGQVLWSGVIVLCPSEWVMR